MKRGRGKAVNSKANTIGDILISNSQQNLSASPVKDDVGDNIAHLIKEDKVVGFVFSVDCRRLKYYPVRLFRGEDFIGGTYTDGIGKFSFEDLKTGEYKLSTEEKNILIRIKA